MLRGICCRPVSLRPLVCPSQVAVVSKPLDESSWLLARKLLYPTQCYRKIRVSQKLGHFPVRPCPKLRHGKSIALSTKLVVDDGRVC